MSNNKLESDIVKRGSALIGGSVSPARLPARTERGTIASRQCGVPFHGIAYWPDGGSAAGGAAVNGLFSGG